MGEDRTLYNFCGLLMHQAVCNFTRFCYR